jgi:hypothetical protein
VKVARERGADKEKNNLKTHCLGQWLHQGQNKSEGDGRNESERRNDVSCEVTGVVSDSVWGPKMARERENTNNSLPRPLSTSPWSSSTEPAELSTCTRTEKNQTKKKRNKHNVPSD